MSMLHVLSLDLSGLPSEYELVRQQITAVAYVLCPIKLLEIFIILCRRKLFPILI